MKKTFISKFKDIFKKKEPNPKNVDRLLKRTSVPAMEKKYEIDDLVGSAKDLKNLLEINGRRKKHNHRYKGRIFISFILSNKHKDLKNKGYTHWKNINQIIQLNHTKVYPYHKKNLREAMDFFEKEIKGIYEINVTLDN